MKYWKKDGTGNRDYISNLPDAIIGNILSRLETTDAVGTCVLSKAWEYKWTSIYNIDITEDDSEDDSTITFVNFVNRVLFNVQNIRSFNFDIEARNLDEYAESCLEIWLSTVFRRNVEKVSVVSHHSIFMPRSLLTCTSLRELDFEMDCTWKPPVITNFPNLTRLYLCWVEIMNENSNSDTLTFHFPVLKTFEMRSHSWLNVRFIEIYAPALISFTSDTLDGDEIQDYVVKIVGASLQKFETDGHYLENFALTKSTISCAALINVNERADSIVRNGASIRRLLKESSCLRSLKLTYCLAQAVGGTKSGLALSRLDKLEKLALSPGEMTLCDGNIGGIYEGLFELLHSAPVLKSLTLEMDSMHETNLMDSYDSDMMEPVPSCVVSHLEELEFDRFVGELHEIHLAMYFLEHSAQLKKLSIRVVGQKKDEVAEQLSKHPKASTCLTTVIDNKTFW